MKFWPFFLATGLGQTPATIVYSYVGGQLSGGAQKLFIGLLTLFAMAIFVTILRGLWQAGNRRDKAKATSAEVGEVNTVNETSAHGKAPAHTETSQRDKTDEQR